MESFDDLTPQQHLEMVQFARARLAEEKQRQMRVIEIKEEILDKAEAALREQAAKPTAPPRTHWSVGERWPTFAAQLVAALYSDHAGFNPAWNR
jgi:hypothetical protein